MWGGRKFSTARHPGRQQWARVGQGEGRESRWPHRNIMALESQFTFVGKSSSRLDAVRKDSLPRAPACSKCPVAFGQAPCRDHINSWNFSTWNIARYPWVQAAHKQMARSWAPAGVPARGRGCLLSTPPELPLGRCICSRGVPRSFPLSPAPSHCQPDQRLPKRTGIHRTERRQVHPYPCASSQEAPRLSG